MKNREPKRKLHIATEHDFLAKLENAGLGEELARPVIGSKGNVLAQKVVEFIRKEVGLCLPIWGTITNGTGPKTSEGFQKKLDKAGIHYSKWGKGVLFQPDFESSISSEIQIDLCVLRTEDILGQKDKGGTRQEIYTGIEKMNGCLLTAESGPNILLQFGHQLKNGEWFLVAMQPIKDFGGDPCVFRVRRGDDGGRWLDAYYDYPGSVWNPDSRWGFSARK